MGVTSGEALPFAPMSAAASWIAALAMVAIGAG